MEDKFDELVAELDLDSVEDFDAKPAKYQVWVLGYDADQNITDYEQLLGEFTDPELAVKYANKVTGDINSSEQTGLPTEVVYLEVLVETVVDVEDIETNVGNLFDETIKIK